MAGITLRRSEMNGIRGIVVRYFLLLCAMASSGCIVVSINPWLGDSSLETKTIIAGTWIDTNENIVATFEGKTNAPGRYELNLFHQIESGQCAYECKLHSVDGSLLLQAGPKDTPDSSPGTIMPVFMLLKADLTDGQMKLYLMDASAFGARAKKAKLIVAARSPKQTKKDEEAVIVGSWTTELEEFTKKNLKQDNFFLKKPLYSFARRMTTNSPSCQPLPKEPPK